MPEHNEAPVPSNQRTTTQAGITLGVVAISYNEEVDLPGFLSHLLPWVDEIVIIDDGSTDATRKIAASCGSKVKFIVSPRGEGEYFSHQRNKGIAAACSDWLLHMDIDERVPPTLAAEILGAIHAARFEAFHLRRRNHFLQRPMYGGGWERWNQVHLARRECLRFSGMFHENCDVSVPAERIGQLQARMVHFNESGMRKRLRKSDAYLEEATAHIRASGKAVSAASILGRPVAEFLRRYILRTGFRDGTPGLISALHSASAVFRAYALVWDEQNALPREQLEEVIREQWRTAPQLRRPGSDHS